MSAVDVRCLEFGAEAFGLLAHVVDEFWSLDTLRKSREVFDQGGHGELAARFVALENEWFEISAGSVDCSRQSGTPGPHDDYVADIFHAGFDSLGSKKILVSAWAPPSTTWKLRILRPLADPAARPCARSTIHDTG